MSVRLPGNQRPFWLNLHARYDLALAERDHGARIAAKPDARVITDGRPGIA
jgi:plasmid maintenance system antidote protein VapI